MAQISSQNNKSQLSMELVVEKFAPKVFRDAATLTGSVDAALEVSSQVFTQVAEEGSSNFDDAEITRLTYDLAIKKLLEIHAEKHNPELLIQ